MCFQATTTKSASRYSRCINIANLEFSPLSINKWKEHSAGVFVNIFSFFTSYHILLIGLGCYKMSRISQIQLKTRIFCVVSSITVTIGKKWKYSDDRQASWICFIAEIAQKKFFPVKNIAPVTLSNSLTEDDDWHSKH